jgi:hypothetical protein
MSKRKRPKQRAQTGEVRALCLTQVETHRSCPGGECKYRIPKLCYDCNCPAGIMRKTTTIRCTTSRFSPFCAWALSFSIPSKPLFQRRSLPARVLSQYRLGPSRGSFWSHSLHGDMHTSEQAQKWYRKAATLDLSADAGPGVTGRIPSRILGDSVGVMRSVGL